MMSTVVSQTLKTPKELSIAVPWGEITGKAWGNPEGNSILGLHGWQDNANSFDTLAPLLPLNDVHFVCIDFPGHGRSSHRPPGSAYNFTDYLFDIKRVIEALNWQRFSIIGHSMGGGVGVLLSSLYPDMVDKLITIDLLAPVTRNPEKATERLRASIAELLKIERDTRPEKTYSKEEAVQRLLKGNTLLDEESARLLVERGTRPAEDDPSKVMFTRDHRLKTATPMSFMDEHLQYICSHMKCEYLAIRALESQLAHGQEKTNWYRDLYSKACKRFEFVEVPGNHHVHMNHPERVAPLIKAFMNGETVQMDAKL